MEVMNLAAVGIAGLLLVAASACSADDVTVATPTAPARPTTTDASRMTAIALINRTFVATRTEVSIQNTERLALISGACTFDDIGYETCTGAVKNIGTTNLYDVLVVIELATDDGTTQSSEDALIQYNPLLAGQESPWTVVFRHNPALTKFRIRFTDISGAVILDRDDRAP